MLQTIKSVADLGNYLASKYGDRPQESCWLIAVNTQLRVLEIQQVAQGTLDGVAIHPRDIFRRLVALNAYRFILVHNHPSGNLKASLADRLFMRQLAYCSTLMQVHFFDFMIIGSGGFVSLRATGELPKIGLETLYDLWTDANKL
ncbi:DNA repair protein RadC [Weissella confusa]|uniref:JAB domain-containing protein n=1 Tax=Weissella confusa TaxID=1583 RepID=UPI000E4D9F34|nr:JAB domain-containing protein [Weissella confusa]MBJ7677290.1 JAB domain-containing protein [Weissella confusa]MBJ7681946.1 JAB domain-containing protein [Weissella confusa]MBJ7683994.1 JAB domain-containing protein [Weissella confusa]MBJ7702798.1 JAB domain-containing protein [Weissella confusa]RGX50104.1 DNA repair protein RadC [Weissella confusa]